MKRSRNLNRGLIGATFAAGLIICCFCPPKILIAILAIWVIVLGLSYRRC